MGFYVDHYRNVMCVFSEGFVLHVGSCSLIRHSFVCSIFDFVDSEDMDGEGEGGGGKKKGGMAAIGKILAVMDMESHDVKMESI